MPVALAKVLWLYYFLLEFYADFTYATRENKKYKKYQGILLSDPHETGKNTMVHADPHGTGKRTMVHASSSME